MLRPIVVVVFSIAAGRTADAEPPHKLAPQVLIDFGLAVIGPAYEHPITDHVALLVEAHVHGTYFLPWFDLGDDAKGVGIELRPTWFARDDGRGLYACVYARADAVSIDRGALSATGFGTSAGIVGGWSFGITDRLDLRLGLGVQYLYLRGETNGTRLGASTPFPTIDGLIGYRL